MNSEQLFRAALGINLPWEVTEVKFDEAGEHKELHIYVDFKRGSKFADESGINCSVHDTVKRTWRHLNFFEHYCYIHCRTPRIKTPEGKVVTVQVPWSRPGSGFTLLFESFVMGLIEREMPVNQVASLVRENAHRLWNIFDYWIGNAIALDDASSLTKLGMDETSQRKGHNYITVAVDLDERRVVHVSEGKDKAAVKAIQGSLQGKGVEPSQVERASIDMSPSFISGLNEYGSVTAL